MLPRFTLLSLVAVVATSCGRGDDEPPPVRSTIGVFDVTLEPGHARVTIAAPGAVTLFDGLPPSDDVGQGYAEADANPPMTGFAVRDVTSTFTMLEGSFSRSDDARAPWRIARSARWAGGAEPLDLLDGAGARIATLRLSRGDEDEHLVVDVSPGDGPERRFSWGIRCDASDHFQGFGAQTWGADARGESIPILLSEEGIKKDLTTDDPTGPWFIEGRRHSSYMPRPEYLARRGYFAVAETDRFSMFAMCSERADVARMQLELPVKLHLFWGPSPADALGHKTAHFGRPRVPPDFAFAPWNDAIFGSAEVRRIAQKLRASGAPSSVIWTEDWRGGEPNGNIPDGYSLKEEWEVDRTLYPDFEAVAKELHGEGFKWLVYFNSFVEKGSKAEPEAIPALVIQKSGAPYFFGDAKLKDATLVDFTNPAGDAWAVSKMKAALALGADGWMGDYSEWLPTDATLAGGSGEDLHARYPVLWQTAQREALDDPSLGASERLSFVRTGGFGTPALADVFWAGDQATDFTSDDGMPTVIPIGIGVGLAGISTFGSDVGGYQTLGTTPTTKEVFFRWTELGAWSPVMRTHHTTAPKASWSWERDDETVAHWVRYAKLHMSLAPWLVSLAQAAHDTGVPIWRSLAFAYPDDEKAWPVADEVLVGDGVLVAPVQAAGATSRDVFLPAGTWYPWAGGSATAGGQTAHVDAALGEIPVFARAGTIVPTFPDGVETLVHEPSTAKTPASVGDDRVVFAFAGADGSFAERGGLRFDMTSPNVPASGDATATFEGAPLPACAATPRPPCLETLPDGVTAHASGPGALVVTRGASVTTIRLSGMAAAATSIVRLRY